MSARDAGGWQPIGTAPEDGSRVRVGHNLDPSSMKAESMFKTSGAFNAERGVWECSAGFVCIDGFLRWQPTHWLPGEGAAA